MFLFHVFAFVTDGSRALSSAHESRRENNIFISVSEGVVTNPAI